MDNGLPGPCMGGAWVHGGSAVGDVVWGWNNFFCIQPGLVRLDLGVGGDCEGEEVFI